MKNKSALSWFGSDSEVAAKLGSMLDACSHVTIPFVGGASILPHLKARAIVANDLHDLAINFYRVITGTEFTRDKLIAMCKSTLSHPSEIAEAARILAIPKGHALPKAWAFWAQCWIGRKGKGGTTKPAGIPSVRRTASGGTNASRIKSAAADLSAWAKQFERCEWECKDFRELLPEVADQAGCGLYVDPPWVGSGNAYLHKFSIKDHHDLAALLNRFEWATVVIRYDDTPVTRDLYPSDRWHWNAATSRTQSNAVRGEVWITKNSNC